jgi:uncharacterized LabA/DUF88 family protein
MAAHPKHLAKIEGEEHSQRLAVLIDADNAQAAVIEGLLAEVARFGEATVKRIYGDFTAQSSAQWKSVLNRFAIKPVQQFAYTSGKNVTDSTLIIDAMDLLYTRRFDGFCLVSSDSDFTGLALRIREEGLMVYGFGERKTPEAFRNVCHKFLFTEVLRQSGPVIRETVPAAAQPAKNGAAAPPLTTKAKGTLRASPSVANGQKPTASLAAGPKAAVSGQITAPMAEFPLALFLQALEQSSDEQGWAHLGAFGSYLTKLRPDFDARNFGFKKLSDLVRARDNLFELAERKVAGSKALYIRAK